MPKFQLLGCKINVGGDRNTTIVRDRFDPITYPEYLVLQALHGGAEHVYDAVVVGEREVNGDERERLSILYGRELVLSVFPGMMQVLPTGDPTIPSEDEIVAANLAAKEARERIRAKKNAEPEPGPADDAGKPEPAPFGGKGDHDGDGKPGGSKASKRAKKPEPLPAADAADDADALPDLTA